MSYCHYRTDPDLGEGKCAMQCIPCACHAYINRLDLQWDLKLEPEDQPRYVPVEDCVYYPVLGEYNNCIIMKFNKDKYTNDDYLDEIHRIVLNSVQSNTAEFDQ
eukprot:8246718-Ditylum_brightwellii.AAC.1